MNYKNDHGLVRFPCGIESYKKERQPHDWILMILDSGERRSFGEDHIGACNVAMALYHIGILCRIILAPSIFIESMVFSLSRVGGQMLRA
jgi:hypothetical protein